VIFPELISSPFGYKWTIGTHVEDVQPEEMETRMGSATAG
jgi:hypothetical protein